MAYFVEMAQTVGTTGVAVTSNMPSHQTDDLLIAFVSLDGGTLSTPAGWSALPSAPTNPLTNGTFLTHMLYKIATSSSETYNPTTTDAYTIGVYCFRDVDTTTPFDGVTPKHQTGTAGYSVTAQTVTTATANALVMYIAAQDTPATTPSQAIVDPGVMWIDGFDSTGTTATTSAHQSAAWYITRTAGAAPAPTFTSGVTAGWNLAAFSIRNKSGGRIPAYIDDVSSPATRISHCQHTVTANNIAVTATLTNTSAINGKTVTGSTPTLQADYGINPYASGLGRTAAITANNALQGFEITLTGGRNLSTGLLMGSLIGLNPKSATFGLGSIAQGGYVVRVGSGASNWEAHQVAAKDTLETTEKRYIFAIKPGDLTTDYGTPGSAVNTSAVTYLQFLMNCPAFAANIVLSELHQVFTQIIAGGDATNPVNIDDLANVGKSFLLPVIQKTGASSIMCYAPVQIGGGDDVNCQIDNGVIQFPRIYDTSKKEINIHVPVDTLGFSLNGNTGDTIKYTNCLFTSPSSYYWEIHSSSTNGATWDLKGTTIIGATVTLRNVTTFQDMTFSGCGSITASGCSLLATTIKNVAVSNNSLVLDSSSSVTDCVIDASKVTSGNYLTSVTTLSLFSGNSFTGGGGHAIRITTPGTYTFSGNIFTGFGANGTNGAAIFNDSGGTVTINVTGGGSTPTYRNGAGATTVVNSNVQVTLTGLKTGSEVRVYTNNAGANDAVVDGVESSGTSFVFSVGSGIVVNIMINHLSYLPADIWGFSTTADTSVPISQFVDRQYLNP